MLETPTKRPRPEAHQTGSSARRLLATRSGTAAVAIVVAVFGAGAIFVFLDRYRDSVDDGRQPVTVLVAKSLIGRGTAGEVVASEELFQASRLRRQDAKEGAITDPGALRGRAAIRDVYPGQQLTTSDFGSARSGAGTRLTARQRAIAVPLETGPGLIGHVRRGDRVDVLAAFNRDGGTPFLRTLVQDVLVLEAPRDAGSGVGSSQRKSVLIRVTDEQAAAVAFAAEYGKVWLTLRPPAGQRESRPSLVTVARLLTGVPPLRIDPKDAGR